MKSDYQLVIDCCEAEIVTATKDWVVITDKGDYYHILFRVLHTSVDIYKPYRAAEQDRYYRELYGDLNHTPYTKEDTWYGVAQMMGLKSPFIWVTDCKPGDGQIICFDGVDVFPAKTRNGIAFVDDGCYTKTRDYTHWQPLPPKP